MKISMLITGCMLAEPEPATSLERLITDEGWYAQQKLDGHRCLMHIDQGEIMPVARSGTSLYVKPYILDDFTDFLRTEKRWVFDGEYVDGHYYVFDVLEAGGQPGHWDSGPISTRTPLSQRLAALERFWPQAGMHVKPHTSLIGTARTEQEKRDLAQRVDSINGEGLVFKMSNSVYSRGKRSRAFLKVKFRNDIDCVVSKTGTDGKANMTLSLWDGEQFVDVGECTALNGDGPSVKVGDVVTVICHGASQGNRVVQPTYPKIRTDKTPYECTVNQLDDIRINKEVI